MIAESCCFCFQRTLSIEMSINTMEYQNKNELYADYGNGLGSWGALLAGYYEATRSALPNECEFWSSLITPEKEILEIGAGSGFLSKEVLKKNPKNLILVEPEIENVKLLELNLLKENYSLTPQILCTHFENVDIPPQDLIIFPYDSLPMITQMKQRAELFEIVSKNLKHQGQFVVHISSQKWVEEYIKTLNKARRSEYTLLTGVTVFVDRYIKRISSYEYIKFIQIEAPDLGAKEEYAALTSIVTPEEILLAAKQANLCLQNRYSDFSAHRFIEGSDKDIFVFRKN